MKKILSLFVFALLLTSLIACSTEDILPNKENVQKETSTKEHLTKGMITPKLGFTVKWEKYTVDSTLATTRAAKPVFYKMFNDRFMAMTTLTSEEEDDEPVTRAGIGAFGDDSESKISIEILIPSPDGYDYYYKLSTLHYTLQDGSWNLDEKDKGKIDSELEQIYGVLEDTWASYEEDPYLKNSWIFMAHNNSVKLEFLPTDGDEDDAIDLKKTKEYSLEITAGENPYLTVKSGAQIYKHPDEGIEAISFILHPLDIRIKTKYLSPTPIPELKGFYFTNELPIKSSLKARIATWTESGDFGNLENYLKKLRQSTAVLKDSVGKIRTHQFIIPKSTRAEFFKPQTEGTSLTEYGAIPQITRADQYLYMTRSFKEEGLTEQRFKLYIEQGKWGPHDVAKYVIPSVLPAYLNMGTNYTLKTTVIHTPKYIRGQPNMAADQIVAFVIDEEKKKGVLLNTQSDLIKKRKWATDEYANTTYKPERAVSSKELTEGRGLADIDSKIKSEIDRTKGIENKYPAVAAASSILNKYEDRVKNVVSSDYLLPFLPSISDWNSLMVNCCQSEPLAYGTPTKAYINMLMTLMALTQQADFKPLIKGFGELRLKFIHIRDNEWYWTSTEVYDGDDKTKASKALAIKFSLENGSVEVKAFDKTEEHNVLPFATYGKLAEEYFL